MPNSKLNFTLESMNKAMLALKHAEVDCESSPKCRNDIGKLQEEVGLITQAVTDCRNSFDRKWVRNYFEIGSGTSESWTSAFKFLTKAFTDCKVVPVTFSCEEDTKAFRDCKVPVTFSNCEEDMSKAANHIHYAYKITSDAINKFSFPNFHFLLKNIKEAQVALK